MRLGMKTVKLSKQHLYLLSEVADNVGIQVMLSSMVDDNNIDGQLVLHLDLIDLEATEFGQTEPRKVDGNLDWKGSCVEDDQRARAIVERTWDIVQWWTSVL